MLQMARKAKELSALEVSRLKQAGRYAVGGVAGLELQIAPAGARSWVLRALIGGKRREMGLGGYPDVPLAGARDAARAARQKIKEGTDPIEAARANRSKLIASRSAAMTFSEATMAYLKLREAEWSNSKHAAQWRTTLETYAFPAIGKMLVRDIDQAHILRILEPIWQTKTETAKRVRGRIENILDWARVRGFCEGENPARWRGHLDVLLQRPTKIQKVEHHPALPFPELASFMEQLALVKGSGASALQFVILTAARSGEVRGATWNEINLREGIWTIPAERMKMKKEHRVALNAQAIALLEAIPKLQREGLVFPAPRGGKLSDMTLTAVLRRMGRSDITAHGFRSTFRDWAAERTNYQSEVVEMALAHTIDNKVEAAYRRGDLFEKRQRLMREWGKYATATLATADVVPLRIRIKG
jgi:integrase